MADYITKVRTTDGDKQIDYNALANLPDLDQKANISYVDEKFAAVPEFDPTEIQEAIDSKADSAQVSAQITNAINEITPSSIGALPEVLTSKHYGYSLPSAGTIGRIFFKRVVE